MHSFFFLMGEFWRGLKRNRFLHFTYGTQVTVSLLVLGIFFILLIGAAVGWSRLGQELEIHVFLQDWLSLQQRNALEDDIRRQEHVSRLVFRSKEEALEQFKKSNNSVDVSGLADNPLPDTYVVKVDDPKSIAEVAAAIQGMTGIQSVKYGGQIVERYVKVLKVVALVSLVTIGLLVLFTVSNINNIIAMSIYERRNEIRIMQLVGATWWFIRWPFLFEGVFFGVIGAVLALLIIWGLLYSLGEALRLSEMALALPNLGLSEQVMYIALGSLLIGLGAIVGFFGSLRTVNTFLGREQELNIEALRMRQMLR
jgi:cell division transport system permease protein